MKLLDGNIASKSIYQELACKINILKKNNIIPGLVVILVGDRKDSITYVNMKHKKCLELGIYSRILKLNTDITTDFLVDQVKLYNKDNSIHGILIQLPLPNHINKEQVLNSVCLEKDVDGFHIENIGRLAINSNPLFCPCTPSGCIELLDRNNIELSGKNVVILGSSRIVGLPLMLMLLYRNATVTICHSKTKNTASHTRNADIVISACGQTHMVKKEWLKESCIVVDVGINSLPDSTKKKGYRLVGDVDFEDVKEKVNAITPVPGGVGPMTISMLMKHTVMAAENFFKSKM